MEAARKSNGEGKEKKGTAEACGVGSGQPLVTPAPLVTGVKTADLAKYDLFGRGSHGKTPASSAAQAKLSAADRTADLFPETADLCAETAAEQNAAVVPDELNGALRELRT